MAKIVIDFEEFGGIAEYNGLTLYIAEPLIINKAADYMELVWGDIDSVVDYSTTQVNWIMRQVVFSII